MEAGHGKRLRSACKATGLIGALARGGRTRGDHQACEHALGCKEKDIPCGLVDADTGQRRLRFGSAYTTSACMVDTLAARGEALEAPEKAAGALLQSNRDNGSASHGVRTPCLHRIVQCADHIAQPIQRLYSPPYHSTDNPIERCWGLLALHWHGTKLIDVETMLEWAKSMPWKGMQPMVALSRQGYHQGIALGKRPMCEIEQRLERHPQLPKGDILIRPASDL
jgi:hypothetical protein